MSWCGLDFELEKQTMLAELLFYDPEGLENKILLTRQASYS